MVPPMRSEPPGDRESRAKDKPFHSVAQELECLYREAMPALHTYLRGTLGADERTTEDISHMAFIKLGQRMRTPPPLKDPIPYLYKVVKNTWIDLLRKPDVAKTELMAEPEQEFANLANEDAFDRVVYLHDQQRRLKETAEALSKLSPRQREIVELHDMSGLSTSQIAEALDITEGTVRYHLSYGRRLLIDLLELGCMNEKGEAE